MSEEVASPVGFTRRCVVCTAALSPRQRLYCSRRCNHKAEWKRRRRRLREQALGELAAQAQELGMGYTAHKVPQFVVPVGKTPPHPSLWQRLRKRVADAWAVLVYLVGEQQGN